MLSEMRNKTSVIFQGTDLKCCVFPELQMLTTMLLLPSSPPA